MSQKSQRVAINTIIMYIRMVFLMFISFFTSRLLLQTLGVEDFGIQSVVGSVAATFISLKTLFSESVQRFLNFEKGKNSLEGQRAVFSVSIIIHIILAFFFVIVVGIAGHWLIEHKLSIPSEKLDTAMFVFYMSIISIFIGIFSVPYDAVIIANEKMGVYAIITIVDGILKLIAVLILPILPFEMLRSYAVLLIAIPVFTLSYQLVYCKKFKECCFSKKISMKYAKNIISLSGWNFFGNLSFSLIHEGVNMLLNVYGGLVFNASRTIAYQVKNMTGHLSNNTLIAVRPQIMQQAASDDKEKVFGNICAVSRISFFTCLLPVIALFPYTEQILDIWLVEVPEGATLFTRLLLLCVVIRSLHEPWNMMYMAFAQIKRMMLIEMSIMLLFLLLFFLSLNGGLPIWIPFVEMIVMEFTIIIGLYFNALSEFKLDGTVYYKKVLMPLLSCCFYSSVICTLFMAFLKTNNPFLSVVYSILTGALYCVVAYLHFDNREKELVTTLLQRFIHKK